MQDNESNAFEADVVDGLTTTVKAIPGKYIWDDRGSQLFDEITRSDTYYPNDAEMSLLKAAATEVAEIVGPQACIVEFGSGASHKVRVLLDALQSPARYIALDISSDFASRALRALEESYRDLEAVHVYADYSRELPPLPDLGSHGVLGFLPGTSIGNMVPDDAVALLARVRKSLGTGWLLIGQDPNQSAARLQTAYGSPGMAALHENLLQRMRRELGAQLDPTLFKHQARVLTDPSRVEAHLVAQAATTIGVADRTFDLAAGESIRTDMSWKYKPEEFLELARAAGWTLARNWTDPDDLFALNLLRSP